MTNLFKFRPDPGFLKVTCHSRVVKSVQNTRYPLHRRLSIGTYIRYTVIILSLLILQLPLLAMAASDLAPELVTKLKSHEVSGTLVNIGSVAPIGRQTVFIADFSVMSLRNPNISGSQQMIDRIAYPKRDQKIYNYNEQTVSASSSCRAPSMPYLSYTCTNNKGEFSLQFAAIATGAYHLTISGNSLLLKIDASQLHTDLGVIRVNDTVIQQRDSIAIVSLAAPLSPGNRHLITANNTANSIANNKPVTYLLDSEILSAYGIKTAQKNIEYHPILLLDDAGKSILDVARYSTILIKGSWRELRTHLTQNTLKLMLDYVEHGGRLLIKDNKVDYSQHSQYIPSI